MDRWHHADEDEFDHDDDIPESGDDWRRAKGIFVLVPIGGEAGDEIHAIQRRYDPKLAGINSPHVTIVGSSGLGPIAPGTPLERLREALAPIARDTAPLVVRFWPPTRFMQTNIVSLPLDPNGPLRQLHDRIAASGLEFGRARFAFSPHATLHFYPTLSRALALELLALRVDHEVVIDRIDLSLTNDPQPPTQVLSLRLGKDRM